MAATVDTAERVRFGTAPLSRSARNRRTAAARFAQRTSPARLDVPSASIAFSNAALSSRTPPRRSRRLRLAGAGTPTPRGGRREQLARRTAHSALAGCHCGRGLHARSGRRARLSEHAGTAPPAPPSPCKRH